MQTPKLTQVSFHPAYSTTSATGTSCFNASMTALDSTGKVWRTFQSLDGNWQPWYSVDTFNL